MIQRQQSGKTESDMVKVGGKNKWKTIIQNASCYKENVIWRISIFLISVTSQNPTKHSKFTVK